VVYSRPFPLSLLKFINGSRIETILHLQQNRNKPKIIKCFISDVEVWQYPMGIFMNCYNIDNQASFIVLGENELVGIECPIYDQIVQKNMYKLSCEE